MAGLFEKVVGWFFNPPTETNVEEPTEQLPVDALKEWTGKARATIIYDSTVDEFTGGGLFQTVKDKPNIAIVATTTDGDVFWGFYSRPAREPGKLFHDPNMFIFSFKSHGRCPTPQMFAVKDGPEQHETAYVRLAKKISFGQYVVFQGSLGEIFLGNEKSHTFCTKLSQSFEGIEDTTLTGKDGSRFTCCRLVAIQLE